MGILKADMHSHIVPGIDDGSKNLEESLALLQSLEKMGYTHVITTPHVYKEHYWNTREGILKGYRHVNSNLHSRKIRLHFRAAAEYYLDEHFEALLARDEILTLPGNYLLFEMSFYGPYPALNKALFDMTVKGYRPILAHPERYTYYHGASFSIFEKLREQGCLFQANMLSFNENYGPDVHKQALKMLDAGLIDFLGTDAHNQKYINELEDFRRSRLCHRILEKYEFKNSELASTPPPDHTL
jgi:protein-tyrosine phosphatase